MARSRSGYTYRDTNGNWYARITVTDGSGTRRNVKRRVKDKSEGKRLLRQIAKQLEAEGESAVDFANKTFGELCDLYQSVYLHKAQYVQGRKVSGVRATDRAQRAVKLFREHFGNRKLRTITHGDLYSFRLMRLKTETQYKRPRTIASVNRELVVLRRMLNICGAGRVDRPKSV